ncbi:MAG: glycosyltransferase [Bacteroides sp.]
MTPQLSIIIPVYKVEKYIYACVDSILCQSYRDYELILVDDGSPDSCGTICDQYANKDKRIKVIHQTNGGLSAARNAGIEIAVGKYITFVDSDDTVAQDTYIGNMSVLLSDTSIDLLEYPAFVHYKSVKEHLWKEEPRHLYGKENIFVDWVKTQGYLHTYACNKIIKAELFKTIRFPLGKTFEDAHTTPLLLSQCSHLYISNQGFYYYYQRNESITAKAVDKDFRNLLEGNLEILKSISAHDIDRKYQQRFYFQLVNILIDLLRCSGDKEYNKRIIKEINSMAPSISLVDLAKLDTPLYTKLKNIPLVLLGLKTHCRLYAKGCKL